MIALMLHFIGHIVYILVRKHFEVVKHEETGMVNSCTLVFKYIDLQSKWYYI